jgi:hypothetical protein
VNDSDLERRPGGERQDHRRSLLLRPRESFAVELKFWFDPRDPVGVSKIVRAAFALRNQNGGFLVIGVDDKTLQPLPAPPDFPPVRECFHPDIIQQIISKYASQSFEVTVDFETIGEQDHPVISIPAGIVFPVACRSDLKSSEGQFLLRENDIYVRTLEANGRISSAKMSWRDIPDLFDRCSDNREADHARFFSRLFRGSGPEVSSLLQLVTQPQADVNQTPKKIIEHGVRRFQDLAAEKRVSTEGFAFWDVALQFIPTPSGHAPNRTFLEALRNANPDLTGWPVWLDSSAFHDKDTHPHVYDDAWEAFIYSPRTEGSFGHWGHLDFWILDPRGQLFLRRVLQDDLGGTNSATAGKTVDPVIAVLRTGEAIAVGQQFARALNCSEDTELAFTFQWSGLKGRRLEAWSSPMRWFNTGGPAKQDSALSTVTLPIDASRETIISRTQEAMLPLTRIFDGYELKEPVVRELVEKLLDRRL